ncbi:hypothetical protein LMB83_05500 [Limosilactobacillus reuteri]|uniref:hypothetical protein n=1 Tax=Limosilactobacillus reuteri TaxID=1598 RepID=UPI001E391CA1|nr:hypothetical protein [Limosilactobacillus reuteri]MCC4411496.1 hypothetical protein [Limosilactobacillus reuteri]
MKKILAINHEFVARSYILFPTLLFAFSIIAHANIITFVWPFIFVYTVEKVMPFILDGRLNLASWSGVTKFCSVIAFIGGVLASIGIYFRFEWLASLAAILIGFGVTGLKLLGDPNKEISGIDLKRINVIAGFSVIIGLIALGILLMKLPLVVGFVFYTFFLGLEVVYAYVVVKRDKTPLDLKFSFNLRTAFPAIAVLTVVFIISFFKKTGRISDFSWALIVLAIIGIILELRNILGQPFKLFRIWLGAIKNYVIIYTLLFAFQQNKAYWIFIVFIELMLSGMLVGALSAKLQKIPLTTRYKTTLIFLTLGLFLTYTDYLYLLGTAITVFCAILLGKWAREQVPDKYSSIDQKLSVFGSLCNQIILFGALELISYFQLDNKSALLIPYIDHQQELQYSREMFYLRVSMITLFVITGIFVIYHDRKYLFVKN